MRGAIPAVLILALPTAGCELVTDFGLKPVSETSAALCSDGRDNDFNGLSDCQDWGCLGELPCCDIPELIAEDYFENGLACSDATCTGASCAALTCGPDPDLWHTWPCPYPRVCDGALRIDKTDCYPAGVLSRSEFGLQPGLRIEVDLLGAPEQLGYFDVTLTRQDESELPGSFDPCGTIQKLSGFAAARMAAEGDGYSLEAQFQGNAIGSSAVVPDPDSPHTLSVGMFNDRRLFFALDGVTFAESPAAVPATDKRVRLAVSGRTSKVAVTGLRIYAGLRCRKPGSLTLVGGSLEAARLLSGDSSSTVAWDRDEVFDPTLVATADGRKLYYTGCLWSSEGTCQATTVAIGRAVSLAGQPFVHDPAGPLMVQDDIPNVTIASADFQVDVPEGMGGFGYLSPGGPYPVYRFDRESGGEVTLTTIGATRTSWDWDGSSLSCPAVLQRDGVVYLWYVGRNARDGYVSRIGLATSPDGINFIRHPGNPVLSEGAPGAFDGASVSRPTVAYDEQRGLFQMWYEGEDFFGETSIGYAVSVDGANWSPAPGNPVLTAQAVGLTTVGGPSVIMSPDGRYKLLVHGTTDGSSRRSIYMLEDNGTLIEQ